MAGGLFFWVALARLLVSSFSTLSAAQEIGVNYGRMGDNLPSPVEVINLYKARGVTRLRILAPGQDVLRALENSGIEVVLGTRNEDVMNFVGVVDGQSAEDWVEANVLPYVYTIKFRYLVIGNEVITSRVADNVYLAMIILQNALEEFGLSIPVTTAIPMSVLGTSYPPSQGAFYDYIVEDMKMIAAELDRRHTPLFVNVYPYLAYAIDPGSVGLDYALFTANSTVVTDGDLSYTNLFDAMVDAVYSALANIGKPEVRVVVSETGWESGGGADMASFDVATIRNAETYNNNVVKHVLSGVGTPKKPGMPIETYLFAMFNENLKHSGPQQHFGLYNPDMTEVYHVNFSICAWN